MLVMGIVRKQARKSRNLFENLQKSGLPPGSAVEMPFEMQSLKPSPCGCAHASGKSRRSGHGHTPLWPLPRLSERVSDHFLLFIKTKRTNLLLVPRSKMYLGTSFAPQQASQQRCRVAGPIFLGSRRDFLTF